MDHEEERKSVEFWGAECCPSCGSGNARGKLFVVLPFFPPTGNHIYITNPRTKARFLSKEGQKFKNEVITYVNQKCLPKIGALDRNAIYMVSYVFFFDRDEVFTKTFGTGKKGAAESRYRKMDVENRIKLVADSFATAIGIDDCQFFDGAHRKLPADLIGPGCGKQIHVFLEKLDGKLYGVPNE